jgi:acyl dehydratase
MATKMQHLGEKTFLKEDQAHFVRISGEVNQMHMDALVARRLMLGGRWCMGLTSCSLRWSIPCANVASVAKNQVEFHEKP